MYKLVVCVAYVVYVCMHVCECVCSIILVVGVLCFCVLPVPAASHVILYILYQILRFLICKKNWILSYSSSDQAKLRLGCRGRGERGWACKNEMKEGRGREACATKNVEKRNGKDALLWQGLHKDVKKLPSIIK